MEPRVSLSLPELKAAGVHLRASEAATIARDVMLRAMRGDLRGIPSPDVIRFGADGDVYVDGAVAAATNVPRAARLLEALLPGFDAPKELRVPGALRLVVARALGVLDLPPYASVQEFADALERFATVDAQETVRG